MHDDLNDLLGIDLTDPTQKLAVDLVKSDSELLQELVALRNAKHLTQSDVGRKMGTSQPAVAALERADADPKLSTIRRYALAIGALIRHSVTDSSGTTSNLTLNASPPATGSAGRHARVDMHTQSTFLQVS